MIGGMIIRNVGASFHATRQRVYSPVSERAASELATRITCRNEIAGHLAATALVLCYCPAKNFSVSLQAFNGVYKRGSSYTSQRVASGLERT
jgi:hypothetical protein